MAFDARVWLAAHKPPVFVDQDGRTYTGRLWSHVEYLKWREVIATWGSESIESYETELKRFLGSMGFPDEAVAKMLQLPDGALKELTESFFVLQEQGRPPAPSTPEQLRPSSPAVPGPTTAPPSTPSAS